MPNISIETVRLGRVFTLDRLARKYRKDKAITALSEVNLQINTGELFGLLGPNGAGKTTLIRILCTLLAPTSGKAFIEGLDVEKEVWKVRRLINSVSGGESCGYGVLSARENLRLFTELYGIPWKVAKPRVEGMLKVVGLDRIADVRVNKLSTGQRQRINFARGFVTEPKVLFLDEPTVGLDVNSSINVRRFIKSWLSERPSSTILLTTHYMAEADELCDRVAIIDRGKVVACDTPSDIKKIVQKETILELILSGLDDIPNEWKSIKDVIQLTTKPILDHQTFELRAILANPQAGGALITAISAAGRRIVDLKTVEPTLEDVFIKLTGRRLAEEAENENELVG